MLKVARLLSQLLHQLSRTKCAHLVAQHQAEPRAKCFTRWTLMEAMLFCHLGRSDSLREICRGLACYQGKFRHLGIWKAPKKSTFSFANQHRPSNFLEDLLWAMRHRFGFSVYKDKWVREIFFKTLKQHLKIKTFIASSKNALRVKIFTALIALLLLVYLLHHLPKFRWSLSNLATMLFIHSDKRLPPLYGSIEASRN